MTENELETKKLAVDEYNILISLRKLNMNEADTEISEKLEKLSLVKLNHKC